MHLRDLHQRIDFVLGHRQGQHGWLENISAHAAWKQVTLTFIGPTGPDLPLSAFELQCRSPATTWRLHGEEPGVASAAKVDRLYRSSENEASCVGIVVHVPRRVLQDAMHRAQRNSWGATVSNQPPCSSR